MLEVISSNILVLEVINSNILVLEVINSNILALEVININVLVLEAISNCWCRIYYYIRILHWWVVTHIFNNTQHDVSNISKFDNT